MHETLDLKMTEHVRGELGQCSRDLYMSGRFIVNVTSRKKIREKEQLMYIVGPNPLV